jgi:hypothetical protein
MPEYISYSGMTTYEQCPRKYEFRYVKKVVRPVASWLFLGTCAHNAVGYNLGQKIETREDLPIEEVVQRFSDVWDKKDPTNGRPAYSESAESVGIDWKGDDQGLLKDTGIESVKSYMRDIAPHTQPIAVEFEFPKREVCGVQIRGRIDAIDDRARLIDLKTAKRKPTQADLDKSLQPTVYALGIGGPIDFVYHYMVKRGMTESFVYLTRRTEDHLRWFREVYLPPIVEGIRAGSFPPRTQGWFCSEKFCEFWQECRG